MENPFIGMKCVKCGKKNRGRGDWNVEIKNGVAQWIICPSCQSPEQNAEAAINEATTDYTGPNAFGLFTGRPKVGD